MKKVLLEQPVIQADKTTLTINRDGSSVSISSYMWVYIYIIGEQDASGRRFANAIKVAERNLSEEPMYEHCLSGANTDLCNL